MLSTVLLVVVHNLNCKENYVDAGGMHMNEYNKITALYSRLSVGDEDRDGGESNSIVNQKAFLERYAQQQRLTNIRHYIDDDESGRFFDRSAVQHIGIYFSYIGKFENELTQLAEPTEEEIRQMREKIEEAQKEKSRAYHRNYSKEYRAKNLEKRREYERIKAREYRAKRKAQAAALPVS